MLGLVPPKYQIGKSHVIRSSILLVMGMICFSKADDNFTWEVEKKALQYGEDLRLSCQVENCCITSVGWVKWKSDDEFDTIFIDVRDLGDEENLKYGGGTDERGIFLIIRNITRDDLNISYSCSYGFTFSKGKVLMAKDAFLGLPITVLTDSVSKGTTEIIPTLDDKLGLYLKIILPLVLVAVLAFIVVGVIIVHYQRRLRNDIHKAQGKDSRQSEAQSNMLPKMEKSSNGDILLPTAQGKYICHQEAQSSIQPLTDPLPPSSDFMLSQMEQSSNGDTLIPTDLEVGRPRRNRSSCSLLSMQSFASCKST